MLAIKSGPAGFVHNLFDSSGWYCNHMCGFYEEVRSHDRSINPFGPDCIGMENYFTSYRLFWGWKLDMHYFQVRELKEVVKGFTEGVI